VIDCCLMPSELSYDYIMARRSYIVMGWCWCPLCTRSTTSVWFV